MSRRHVGARRPGLGRLSRGGLLVAVIVATSWVPPARGAQPVTATKSQKAAQPLFKSGLEALQEGRVDEAAAFYEAGLKLDPGAGSAWLFLAAAQLAQGKGAEAQKSLSAARALGFLGPASAEAAAPPPQVPPSARKLPPEVAAKLDPDLVRKLETAPELDAPKVRGSLNAGMVVSISMGGKNSGRNEQSVTNGPAGAGFTRSESVTKSTGAFAQDLSSTSHAALAGLVTVSSLEEVKSKFGNVFSERLLTGVEVNGPVFPLVEGNSFEIVTATRTKSRTEMKKAAPQVTTTEQKLTLRCKVGARSDASSAARCLTGSAVRLDCTYEASSNGASPSQFPWVYLYAEALGRFIGETEYREHVKELGGATTTQTVTKCEVVGL